MKRQNQKMELVGRALRVPYKIRAAGAAALQLCLLGTIGFAQDQTDSGEKPGWSKRPGRLMGWGSLGFGLELAEMLPTGADAEGFIAVVAGPHQSMALHKNGTVFLNGKPAEADLQISGSIDHLCQGPNISFLVQTMSGAFNFKQNGRDERIDVTPPSDMNLRQMSLAQSRGIAIAENGNAFIWKPTKPEEAADLMQKFGEVTSVRACGYCIGALKPDGKAIFDARGIAEVGDASNPVTDLQLGYAHAIVLFADGTVACHGSNKHGQTDVPDFGEKKVTAIHAGPQMSIAVLEDGSWVKWGDDINDETDLERLKKLWAFSLGGGHNPGYADTSGFVIGIAPSFVDGFFSDHVRSPELKAALDGLEKERLSTSEELHTFERKYLTELEKLKASAVKNNRPKILALIEDEMTNFRDLTRPVIESPPVVAKFQKIWRDQAPELQVNQKKAESALYQRAVTDLHALQDSLTQAQNLSAAIEAREAKEMAESALAYRTAPPPSAPEVKEAMPQVPEADRIFSMDDPVVPGDLVFVGTIRGSEIPMPATNDQKDIVAVRAAQESWLAIQDDGTFTCDSPESHLTEKGVPGSIRKLKDAAAGFAYVGITPDGELVNWGWPEDYTEKKFLPPTDVKNAVSICLSKRNHDGLCGAALLADGTLRMWGEPFVKERFPWKKPEGLTDVVQVAAINEGLAFLKKDGTVEIIATSGPKTVKIPDGDIAILKGSGAATNFGFVTKDGRAGLIGHNGVIRMSPTLTSVVDIAVGREDFLALRADGTWVAESTNSPEQMEALAKELKGVRRIDIGGMTDERFVIGIRSPE